MFDHDLGLIVVADGMGGHQSGEKASRIAVNTVAETFKELTKAGNAGSILDKSFSEATNRLGFSLKMANEAIFEAGRRNPGDSGMGTTCTAALIEDDRLSLAHVGDSRCYLIRHGQLEQLTMDHSLVMEKVRHGLISKEQAAASEQNILTRSLGTESGVLVDLVEQQLLPGDVLVLCSDGLDKELTNDEILK